MNDLRLKFQTADRNRTGALTIAELQSMGWGAAATHFTPNTIRTLIFVMDADGNNSIDFNEYAALSQFITTMETAFTAEDVKRSKQLDVDAVVRALNREGFQFDRRLVELLCRKYGSSSPSPMPGPGQPWTGTLSFDDFCLISAKLAAAKASFARRARGGQSVTLTINEFMSLVAEL